MDMATAMRAACLAILAAAFPPFQGAAQAPQGSDGEAVTAAVAVRDFFKVVQAGDLRRLQRMIDLNQAAELPLDLNGRLGLALLTIAAEEGYGDIVFELIDAGVDPNVGIVYANTGSTALMAAAESGRRGAVDVLIRRGADLDVQDRHRRWTALMHAVRHGNTGVVRSLVAAGARLDLENEDGETALEIARKRGVAENVALLESAARGF